MSYVVLAAGGTGGHIHAALAIGERFESNGYKVCYFSGDRYLDYQLLKDYRSVHLKAQALKGKGWKKMLVSIWDNMRALCVAIQYFRKKRPHLIMGVGGYIGGPVLVAGFLLRIPIFILEQNGVLGLTNRMLLFLVQKIFVHFQSTKGVPSFLHHKVIVAGNPIRADFFYSHFPKEKKPEKLKIVVFGGSLGATSINQLIKELILKTPPFPLHIIHQVGKDRLEVNNEQISPLITYEQREFLPAIVNEYKWCDLIICRSGASTISELRVVKKPCILIPYPYHSDRQQFFNAEFLKQEVRFPVYIETCESLKEQGFHRSMAILSEVWQNAYDEKHLDEEPMGSPLATSIIFSEMVKYVRS